MTDGEGDTSKTGRPDAQLYSRIKLEGKVVMTKERDSTRLPSYRAAILPSPQCVLENRDVPEEHQKHYRKKCERKKQRSKAPQRALPASKQAAAHSLKRCQAAVLPQRRRKRNRFRVANTVVAKTASARLCPTEKGARVRQSRQMRSSIAEITKREK